MRKFVGRMILCPFSILEYYFDLDNWEYDSDLNCVYFCSSRESLCYFRLHLDFCFYLPLIRDDSVACIPSSALVFSNHFPVDYLWGNFLYDFRLLFESVIK